MCSVFSPIEIGNLVLKNRIIMPAIHLGYSDRFGVVNDRICAFYKERALGQTSLIIVGACYVELPGKFMENSIGIDSDDLVEGHRRLVETIHNSGSKAGIQLTHGGGECSSLVTGSQPVAPSSYKGTFSREISRELSINEIHGIQTKFVEAGLRAREAGYDLIEIHCIEDFLVHEFLSPHINTRSDGYGGDLYMRLRFVKEIISQIKSALGDSFPISVRIPGDELVPGSNRNSIDEWRLIAKALEDEGVDLLNVTQGCNVSPVPQLYMNVPAGAFVYISQFIKGAVKIPVCTSTRINNLDFADNIIFEQKADLVAMGRQLIADPLTVSKCLQKQSSNVIPCIACNQGCFDSMLSGNAVGCLVNPRAGNEWKFPIISAEYPKKIVVIGGGPAGMTASLFCALRGHSVSLYEKSDSLGGSFLRAGFVPGREVIQGFIKALWNQLTCAGVNIFLEKEIDASFVEKEKVDAVIISTGCTLSPPDIKGINHNRVYSAIDLFDRKISVGSKILIIGGGGVGCDAALYLARMGSHSSEAALFLAQHNLISSDNICNLVFDGNKEIVIIEKDAKIGADIGKSSRWVIAKELQKRNIKILTESQVVEICDNHVFVKKSDQMIKLQFDTIIFATGDVSYDRNISQYYRLPTEIIHIGDCNKRGNALDAIRQGFELGIRI